MAEQSFPVEHFPALDAIAQCRSAFVRRIPGIDVAHEKAEGLRRLEAIHREVRIALGLGDWSLLTAEQVHGNGITVIDRSATAAQHFAGCDGMITNQPRMALGIHVADCCAVYLVDPITPAVGLVHSGKKGTELNIAGRALDQMKTRFGSKMSEMVVQLSPCIRPPHYEIDFAARIVEECRERGVQQIHDTGLCTACDVEAFYSYRMEQGRTGRMLALLGLR